MRNRERMIQRYTPFVRAQELGAGLVAQVPLFALTSEEKVFVQALTQAAAVTANISTEADMERYTAALTEKIAELYDQPATPPATETWAEAFDRTYQTAEIASRSTVIRPGQMPPKPLFQASLIVPLAAADKTLYREIEALQEGDLALFRQAKYRLGQMIHWEDKTRTANRAKSATQIDVEVAKTLEEKLPLGPSTPEKEAVIRLKNEGSTGVEVAIDREAMKLVQAYKDFYEALYKERIKIQDKWISEALRRRPAGGVLRNTSIVSQILGWTIFLPFTSIAAVPGMMKEMMQARASGNKNWLNRLGPMLVGLGLSLPITMVSTSLMGISLPLVGGALAAGAGLLTKLGLLVGGGLLAANPVGALIVGAIVAVIALAVVATSIYRISNYIYNKKYPEKAIENAAIINPEVMQKFKNDGFRPAAINSLARAMAQRIDELENKVKSTHENKQELVGLKQQLEALKGFPTGLGALFGKGKVDDLYSASNEALAMYCKGNGQDTMINIDGLRSEEGLQKFDLTRLSDHVLTQRRPSAVRASSPGSVASSSHSSSPDRGPVVSSEADRLLAQTSASGYSATGFARSSGLQGGGTASPRGPTV